MERSLSHQVRVAALNALAWIAPAAAGRFLADLFTTPRRLEAPQWERRLALQGRPRRIAGLNLTEFGAKVGPPIILLHGWEGRGLQLGHFVAPLKAIGARVIAVDGPAHGDSLGVTSGPFDFAKGLLDLQAVLGPFRGVVAHSMAGPSTAIAVARGLKVERFVALGAPSDLSVVLDRFCRWTGVSERVRSGFREEMSRRTGVSVDESSVAHWAQGCTLPVLVIHDPTDAEVPIDEGRGFVAAYPGARWMEVDGGGHRRMLKAVEVTDAVAAFFGARGTRSS